MPRTTSASIGFPPPLLGPHPLRLTVLQASGGVVALNKPAGVVWERDALNNTEGVVEAVHRQWRENKPELLALGIDQPASAWPLETESAGIGLLAPRGLPFEQWRNAFGSALLQFTYHFLASDTRDDDTVACTLPVAEHISEPRALVSHTTGKKSATAFRRLSRAGSWSWWEAVTLYPRRHQVRLHAAECGLRIVGETHYATGDVITLARLSPKQRLNKGEDHSVLDGICLRLAEVDCTRAGVAGWEKLTAPEPEKWSVLRKKLGRVNGIV